jgi:hypothetical protein
MKSYKEILEGKFDPTQKDPLVYIYQGSKTSHRTMIGHMLLRSAVAIHGIDSKKALSDLKKAGNTTGKIIPTSQENVWIEWSKANADYGVK